MPYRKALIFVILFSTFLHNLHGQEDEKPVLAIREVTSWGPDYKDFFPEIAIYRSGTILIKMANDSSARYRSSFFEIYQSLLPKSAIDSLLSHLPIKEFYELKGKYSPYEEQTKTFISDAPMIYISVYNEGITRNVAVYNTFAKNDSNFSYNPKAAKVIYDKLLQLKDSLVKSKNFKPWAPEKIEVFFIPETTNLYTEMGIFNNVTLRKWPKSFPGPDSPNTYPAYDISGFKSEIEKNEKGISITDKQQIDFIIKNCKAEYCKVNIDGKKWIVRYSYTADNCKFVDYLMYLNCM